jgi:hypothetical protein
MRIVLLSARRLRPHQITAALADLGVASGEADVRIVTWGMPVGRLPVAEHIVLGPDPLSPIRSVRVASSATESTAGSDVIDAEVNDAEENGAEGADAEAALAEAALADAGPVLVETEPALTDADLAETDLADADEEPLADAVLPAPDEASEPLSPARSGPPRTGLARLQHGLRWRANRARMTVAGHPVAKKVLGSTKVRRIAAKVTPGGLSGQFALRASGNARIRWICGRATVVVAIDQNAHRAAWLLARRVPEVPIVVGLPAAKRILDEARTRSGA